VEKNELLKAGKVQLIAGGAAGRVRPLRQAISSFGKAGTNSASKKESFRPVVAD